MTRRHYGEISLDDYRWLKTVPGVSLLRWRTVSALGLGVFLVVGALAGSWWHWGGQGTTTLTFEQATRIMNDPSTEEWNLTNAMGRLSILGEEGITTIGKRLDDPALGNRARTFLDNLDRHLQETRQR